MHSHKRIHSLRIQKYKISLNLNRVQLSHVAVFVTYLTAEFIFIHKYKSNSEKYN